jgi:hypothetical protein
MKLKQLLKQITPLPWRFAEMDNDKLIPTVRIFGRRKHDPSKEICFGRIDSVPDARYACHAATVLPELLAAERNLQENWERNLTEPMDCLNEAIARAESVSQPKKRANHNHRTIPHANGTHYL